jgi:phage-related minor tail protein
VVLRFFDAIFERRTAMADRIKGITVEIGGDTTKLSDALKNVKKSIRQTQDQLRDVNKFLKLDPGSADLLVQKQKYFSEAISDTK